MNSVDLKKELKRVTYRKQFFQLMKNIMFALMGTAALATLIAVIWLPVLRIYGQSMNTTLNEGDIVLSVKGSQFETGDIIAFYYNNKILVKRVIANGGDWVSIDYQGKVFVNQEPLDEPYVTSLSLGDSNITYPYQVPENQLFVMGDHRETSLDSRNTAIGTVAEEQVVGKIVFKVFPLNEIGFVD